MNEHFVEPRGVSKPTGSVSADGLTATPRSGTLNATGACRLVGESYRFQPWSRLLLTTDNHNSVNGLREFARAHGVPVRYVPMGPTDLRIHGEDVSAALGHGPGGGRRPGLFAYPAQSNFSGVQHPLAWVSQAPAWPGSATSAST